MPLSSDPVRPAQGGGGAADGVVRLHRPLLLWERLLGLNPADAFDAALVTGGLPLICAEWPHGAGLWDFLAETLNDPVSALLVSAERSLAADPYPRFWLQLLGPSMEEIERGRGDLTVARIRDSWTSWPGRAIEPLLREALARILPDDRLPAHGP